MKYLQEKNDCSSILYNILDYHLYKKMDKHHIKNIDNDLLDKLYHLLEGRIEDKLDFLLYKLYR